MDDLDDVLSLQEEVLADLRPRPWLRANSDAMLKECLDSQVSLGARRDGRLVSLAVLYDDRSGSESIRGYFTPDPTAIALSVNLKVVMTLPADRGNGVSRTLVELLEQRATELGKTEILCTIHPGNKPSQRLFGRLGYRRIGNATTTYGSRRVYARTLPVVDRRWAR